MSQNAMSPKGMSLFDATGERKYLSAGERTRFYDALDGLDDPKERSFCETLYWTGCRPSEALALTAQQIDPEECRIIIRSLKKRGPLKGRHLRAVPVPDSFMRRLCAVHAIAQSQANGDQARLWPFSRTTAWKRVRAVMAAAGLSGRKACARGLRHAYGVNAAVNCVPQSRIRVWLGHADDATTAIYLEMAAPEDHAIARRMWGTAA